MQENIIYRLYYIFNMYVKKHTATELCMRNVAVSQHELQ